MNQSPGSKEKTILIIDDEEDFAQITALTLELEGYSVITALNGTEGVNIFLLHKESISIVLCDLNLPKMSGKNVIQTILAAKPDVKIIIMSGTIDESQYPEFINHPSCVFLQKPFSIKTLLAHVEKVTV